MITFLDFRAVLSRHFSGIVERASDLGFGLRPDHKDFEKSHCFYLGDGSEYWDSISSVLDDLLRDRDSDIPMPYPDLSLISYRKFPDSPISPDEPLWECDRLIHLNKKLMDDLLPVYEKINPKFSEFMKTGYADPARAYLYVGTNEISARIGYSIAFQFFYPKGRIEKEMPDGKREALPGVVYPLFQKGMSPDKERTIAELSREREHQALIVQDALATIQMITSISHPMNYIVRTTPKITDHEKRRIESGKSSDKRKRPYFIVVCHDVLVQMRKGIYAEGGEVDRNSPTPHHRRGHWMRLAERCRHAKMLGKEKTWRRPAFVGDVNFGDEKNFYEVLMDFSSSQ
jgi:hypothetical protein